MILGLEHCVTTKTDGNQEVECVANHDMNSDSVVSVFLWPSDNIASKIGFGHLNHSWQTRSVADWLPREPAPLAEVVDDNNNAVPFQITIRTQLSIAYGSDIPCESQAANISDPRCVGKHDVVAANHLHHRSV